MSIWRRVTREAPCPICKRSDWCQFGDFVIKCMRVESQVACASGGWYHKIDQRNEREVRQLARIAKRVESRSIDARGLIERWRGDTTREQLALFASNLGVSIESLLALDACWAKPHNAWAFPMRDASGDICGIRLRSLSGNKWAVTGSRQGVFLPDTLPEDGIAYTPEGPTDTAALLTLGLFAVGRPSVNAGLDVLRATLDRLGVRRLVVVADNDELKQLGNKVGRPGLIAADQVGEACRRRYVVFIPISPCKDVRDFVRNGGTRASIESDVRSKTWRKK